MSAHDEVIAFLDHHWRVATRQADNRLAGGAERADQRQWAAKLARAMAALKGESR